MLSDIASREDIELLVRQFYARVIPDPLIGVYFTRVVHFSWEDHIPVMISFWESILLGARTYEGNPMIAHQNLHRAQPLEPLHFSRWLSLWEQTLQEYFSGPVAEAALSRASSIAGIMQAKLEIAQ